MPNQPTTRVVSTARRDAGRRSAEGRARDERGRLLPRQQADPDAPPTPAPADSPTTEPAPRFRQVRRRWSPLNPRRRRTDDDGGADQ